MKIIYIDIDTMSPHHMSAYGYNRTTTPNIDQLCKERDVAKYTQMYTSDAPCLPSRTSMITGNFGIRHGAVDHGGKYADLRSEMANRDFEHSLEFDGLFGLLKRAGLRTASVSSFSSRHSSWHFNCGFNEVYCYGDSAEQQAPEIHNLTKDWLKRNGNTDDWFLHVHLWDPHTPYRAPSDYRPDFADQPFDYWVSEELLDTHKQLIGPHTASTLDMFSAVSSTNYERDLGSIQNLEDLKTTIDGYDIGIHYADHHIGLILDQLKELNIYEDTIVVISADHGENMGDLGKYSEHGTADVATCHIPFIIKIPGQDYSGCNFDQFHYNLDLVPTVADYFNLEPKSKQTRWDGKSLVPELMKAHDNGHDHLILSQMSHVLQRAVRFDNYLYIQTYHDGYHPYFDSEMLFDIENDPHELNNIAEFNKELVNRAKVILFDWNNEQMSNLPNGHYDDPLWYIYHNGGPHHAHLAAQEFVDCLQQAGENEKAEVVRQTYKNEF